MLRALAGFGRFWWDFIVGDDWRIAAGVGLTLIAGGLLVRGAVVRTDAIAVGAPCADRRARGGLDPARCAPHALLTVDESYFGQQLPRMSIG